MTQHEIELIRAIRESNDPAKAMETAMDILTSYLAGESMESITIRYGLFGTSV